METNNVAQIVGLTKKFGDKLAVDGVSFEVKAGRVTGFLGPNGSGKTTTMRCMLGLTAPTSGTCLIGGKKYSKLKNPTSVVGALIDAKALHKSRSARAHLETIAFASGLPKKRVDEVLDFVGLQSVAKKPTGKFSLGMTQRVGIAAALLGDPRLLILDEPVNGLDPEGVKWVRDFCREFAATGKAVLISSHLMSEVEQTADDLVIIGQGKIIMRGTVDEIIASKSSDQVVVSAADTGQLKIALATIDARFEYREAEDEFVVHDLPPEKIGELALLHQVVLTKLDQVRVNLEEAFMSLTEDRVEYHAHTPESEVH